MAEATATAETTAAAPTVDAPAEPPPPVPLTLSCPASVIQAGLVECRTLAGVVIQADGVKVARADADGRALFGVRRDQTSPVVVRAVRPDPSTGEPEIEARIEITPRKDIVRTIRGFDCDKVEARTPEQIAHVARSSEKKKAAFAGFLPDMTPVGDFVRPAEGPYSSLFGATRTYIGEGCESTSVHYGLDIAAPTGAPIRAPKPGVVSLADPDLYYEGGCIFLDHGQGVTSVFMHMSQVDVQPGQRVEAGDILGAVGATGRVTGPHLHWAVKWRNPLSENRDADFYVDPALLLSAADAPPPATE